MNPSTVAVVGDMIVSAYCSLSATVNFAGIGRETHQFVVKPR